MARSAGHRLDDDPAVGDAHDPVSRVGQDVIVLEVGFVEAALDPGAEGFRRVARDFAAEQVAGDGDVEVRLALQERQIDDAERPDGLDVVRILDPGLDHRRAGRFDRPLHARLADKHVMGFLGQHEPAGARQRIEAALGERGELHLAVAVGEESEHEERQPVRRLLVEGAENARIVHLAAAALEQRLRLPRARPCRNISRADRRSPRGDGLPRH